jgi:hypothetical protein
VLISSVHPVATYCGTCCRKTERGIGRETWLLPLGYAGRVYEKTFAFPSDCLLHLLWRLVLAKHKRTILGKVQSKSLLITFYQLNEGPEETADLFSLALMAELTKGLPLCCSPSEGHVVHFLLADVTWAEGSDNQWRCSVWDGAWCRQNTV